MDREELLKRLDIMMCEEEEHFQMQMRSIRQQTEDIQQAYMQLQMLQQQAEEGHAKAYALIQEAMLRA